ncbi:MAG: hypothetical protein ACYTEQ_01280 [Planctomycetota bacterium]|jgi:hypothetical protein
MGIDVKPKKKATEKPEKFLKTPLVDRMLWDFVQDMPVDLTEKTKIASHDAYRKAWAEVQGDVSDCEFENPVDLITPSILDAVDKARDAFWDVVEASGELGDEGENQYEGEGNDEEM